MRDHVHLVLTPAYAGDSFYSVAEIMQGIKSASAHKINRLLARTGQVWQRESFDRVLRREESIHAKVGYMIQNPVRAGLVQNATEYRWLWVPDMAKSAWHKSCFNVGARVLARASGEMDDIQSSVIMRNRTLSSISLPHERDARAYIGVYRTSGMLAPTLGQ